MPNDNGGEPTADTGAVFFIFCRSAFNGATFESQIGIMATAKLRCRILNASDLFGWSVSLDGNRLAVGGNDGFNNLADRSGEVHLFLFEFNVF